MIIFIIMCKVMITSASSEAGNTGTRKTYHMSMFMWNDDAHHCSQTIKALHDKILYRKNIHSIHNTCNYEVITNFTKFDEVYYL
jgi:hypothetical protein